MSFIWMIIFIVLILIELSTVNLVSIWFAIGALGSFIFSFWVKSLTWQIAVFILVSTVALLLTKNFVKKVRGGEITPTNLDRVIGKIGIVTEEITKLESGEVKVDGKRWSAISSDELEIGDEVIIEKIDGVKLIVRKKEK